VKLLVIVWLVGIALVLGLLLAPSLRVALLVASAVYFVAVAIWCVPAAKELNANVQWMEEQLSNVRYGTVTERNAPLV
jgi:hypothetical protein